MAWKRLHNECAPEMRLTKLSALAMRSSLLWTARHDLDLVRGVKQQVYGGPRKYDDHIEYDGLDDYIKLGTLNNAPTGAASVTLFIDCVPLSFATDFTDVIFDATGVNASNKLFAIMAEDNALSFGFFGHRIITTKGDISAGDHVRCAISITDGVTGSAVIYINGRREAWTTEGGASQTQSFDSVWVPRLGATVDSSGVEANFSACKTYSAAIFPTALNDNEMAALTDDPYNALFVPRRRWITAPSGIINVSASLGATCVIAQSATSDAAASSTQSVTAQQSQAASADVEAASSLAQTQQISESAAVDTGAGRTEALTAEQSQAAEIGIEAGVTETVSAGITPSAAVIAEASVTVSVTGGQSQTATATVGANAAMSSQHGQTQITGSILDGAVTIAVTEAMSSDAIQGVGGALTMALTAGDTETVSVSAETAITLSSSAVISADSSGSTLGVLHTAAMQAVISAVETVAMEVGATITGTYTIAQTGSTAIVVQTPSGRTYIVEAESRVYLVDAEDRTYTIQ